MTFTNAITAYINGESSYDEYLDAAIEIRFNYEKQNKVRY